MFASWGYEDINNDSLYTTLYVNPGIVPYETERQIREDKLASSDIVQFLKNATWYAKDCDGKVGDDTFINRVYVEVVSLDDFGKDNR